MQDDENINGFLDLADKRVNIPNEGSGSRVLYENIMNEYNLSTENFFSKVYEKNISELENLFCTDKIDAAIFYVGHPNQAYQNVIENCPVKFVSFSEREIKKYLRFPEYYSAITMPANVYDNQNEEIKTFGSQLVLSISYDVPDEVVYDFTKVFFTHFDEVIKLSPILSQQSPMNIFNIGGVAPIHKGATKYYHEQIIMSLPY